MTLFIVRCWCLALLVITSLPSASFSQKLAINEYQVRVVTKDGHHFRGILTDVDGAYLYVNTEAPIPLSTIRKVAVRRKKQTTILITGAILGGLVVGYLGNQSLQTYRARSAVVYGLNVVFAAAGGAAGGLLLGSAVSKVTRRVIRPINPAEPEISLYRQLEPFSLRHQQEFLNRLPKTSP